MGVLTVHHTGPPLNSDVNLDGGKHAFAHSLACAALANEARLTNVPAHHDAWALRRTVELIFRDVRYNPEQRTLFFGSPRRAEQVIVPAELTSSSRSIYVLIPALLLRGKEVVIEGVPTGCAIGTRPSDWYLATLASFGVEASDEAGCTRLRWPTRVSADIHFPYPTMTGTVIAIAAAAVSPGTSHLYNASVEPSCVEQLECLRSMRGTYSGELPTVTIQGHESYDSAIYHTAADRIQAVTLVVAALLTRGHVTVRAPKPLRMPEFVSFLQSVGASVRADEQSISAAFPTAQPWLNAVHLQAGSEPMFSSDWVTFAALLLATRSQGRSSISDDVFPRRFQFIEALRPLGLRGVQVECAWRGAREVAVAIIDGDSQTRLTGGRVDGCPDIRGSAAVSLAGLIARKPVVLADDFHVRRGYTSLARDLRALGASKAEVVG